jgi:RNA polymerase sigma factor (sigma-70 family)
MANLKSNNDKTGLAIDDESVKRRTELFIRYVLPHKSLIYKLCINYTFCPSEVEDNYNEVLINFFKYIETYDPERSIQTWLHIITKRYVSDLNARHSVHTRRNSLDVSQIAGALMDETTVSESDLSEENYRSHYNDDILEALDGLKPIYREALVLQQAGYKLEEIMEISYRNGHLKTKNLETIKSRLFLAKKQMRNCITRDGERRKQ